jgi:hypothetical protein
LIDQSESHWPFHAPPFRPCPWISVGANAGEFAVSTAMPKSSLHFAVQARYTSTNAEPITLFPATRWSHHDTVTRHSHDAGTPW